MNKLEQAARQALGALVRAEAMYGQPNADIQTALREALAEQAEQEPVGYFAYDEEHDIWEELTGPNAPGATPLYTAPARTKDPCNPLQDLTDDEIMKINVDTASIVPTCDRQFHFARAVIAADREKNK